MILAGILFVNEKKELLLLYRKKHNHYEPPGGKVEKEECVDFLNPTKEELKKVAIREIREELGNDFKFSEPEYFVNVDFTTKDNDKAIVHKFISKIISGEPKVNEPDKFSELKWISINKLDEFDIAPDIPLFKDKLKEL